MEQFSVYTIAPCLIITFEVLANQIVEFTWTACLKHRFSLVHAVGRQSHSFTVNSVFILVLIDMCVYHMLFMLTRLNVHSCSIMKLIIDHNNILITLLLLGLLILVVRIRRFMWPLESLASL